MVRFHFLILLGMTLTAAAPLHGAEIPFLTGRVNDDAEILSAETIAHLNDLLRAHEDSTSNQVVVLTIPSLEGESLEAYSIRVAETWKLGQKGKDNGVLLLVVRDDRKVRIEVGRGLEGDLPDITCGIIIRREIIPRFKEGNYDAGVTAGIEAILKAIRGSYTATETETHSTEDLFVRLGIGLLFTLVVGIFTLIALVSKGGQGWFLYVFLLPFWGAFPSVVLGWPMGAFVFAAYALGFPPLKLWLRRSKQGSAWLAKAASSGFFASGTSGGWTSGGGFSGGGGGFSGGGASGSW